MPHIFAIGDVAGNPMLAHKAVHEGHFAAEAAAGLKSLFDAKIVPNVTYMIGEICPAIEMGADAIDLSKTKAIALKRVPRLLFDLASYKRKILRALGRDD